MSKKTRGIQMAATKAQDGAAAYEVGDLRERKKVSRPVFAGVCIAENWRPGKIVTEKEFDDAVARFKGGTTGRRVKDA